MTGFSARKTEDFVKRYWPAQTDLPKHETLSRAFTKSIMDGFWAAGARLPTEAELVRTTPCSLGTVQRALRNLAFTGIIQRRRGSGSIVSDLSRRIDGPWHMRFLDADGPAGSFLPVATRVLQRDIISDHGPWSADLGQTAETVVRIERVMVIDDRFDVFNLFYALADNFPELVTPPLSELNGINLKDMMARGQHLAVERSRQLMRFEHPPAWISQKCRWPKGERASVLNVVGYAPDGQAMYYQDYFIPPTELTLDLGMPPRTYAP